MANFLKILQLSQCELPTSGSGTPGPLGTGHERSHRPEQKAVDSGSSWRTCRWKCVLSQARSSGEVGWDPGFICLLDRVTHLPSSGPVRNCSNILNPWRSEGLLLQFLTRPQEGGIPQGKGAPCRQRGKGLSGELPPFLTAGTATQPHGTQTASS